MPNADTEDSIRPPTPPVDEAVASLASRLQISRESDDHDYKLKDTAYDHDGAEGSDGDDELFDELEKEFDDMAGLRERRLEELKAEMTKVKDMRENEHGRLTEIVDEKEVIKTSAKESRCIVHFYHRDFRRCAIMDKHLEILAPRYFRTRFIKVFVENVPWLVEKLQIKMLPCLICFVGGVSKDRVVGFEELGNDDGFQTGTLELRLMQSGVLDKPQPISKSLKTPFGGGGGVGSSSSGIRDRERRRDSDDGYSSDD